MLDFVVHANIERFEKLIATETDSSKAEVLRTLLAQEKAKLALPVGRDAIVGPARRHIA